MSTVGETIKKLRIQKGLTQRELANMAGISEISIRKYESGERNPKLEIMQKIADAINTSLQILLLDNAKFIKDLLSCFQTAYRNSKNYFPKEYEVINTLIDNGILSEERTDILLADFNNLSVDEIQKILEYIKQLDINAYTDFLINNDILKMKIIGNNIFKQRNERNMSIEDLGMQCGLESFYLERLENGFSDYPPNDILRNIAAALHIKVSFLIRAEFFGYEVLYRAVRTALKQLTPDNNDVFMILGNYVDYNTLFECYNNITKDLSSVYIKGILKYISDSSKEEFNRLYNDLVSTDIYNLDSELEDYCQSLYLQTIDPLDFMADDDKEILQSLGYIKDGKLSLSQNKPVDKNVVFLENGFITLSSIKTPFMCKEYIANLINYRIKDFDFNSLSDEDFNTILQDTLDFIEFEVHKIKKEN